MEYERWNISESRARLACLENGEWQGLDGSESRQTQAALPPAHSDRLANKPITLRGSSLSLGVTGQTTSTRTHTHKNQRTKIAVQIAFQTTAKKISSSVLLTVWIVSLFASC